MGNESFTHRQDFMGFKTITRDIAVGINTAPWPEKHLFKETFTVHFYFKADVLLFD